MADRQKAPRRWRKALDFAISHHGKALRKGGGRVPYVTHVVDVAETLAYHYPERDHLVVAGLLHDAVEDTDATFAQVRKRFGKRVAKLVRAVSKDDEAMQAHGGWTIEERTAGMTEEQQRAWLWRARREFMLAHLDVPSAEDEGARDVLRLKAADAQANLLAIARDLRHLGPAVWERFNVGREESLWFYRAITERVEAGIGGEPLAGDLRAALAAVESA